MPKIAIYAGHGGTDYGAMGNGLKEKDLNLAVSNAASSILRGWGYWVFNNRTTDVNRSITADAAYANENRVDALVEIHQNSNEGTPGTGSEVFYSIRDTGRGRMLASSILRQLVSLGFADRGIKTQLNAQGQDAFAIIRLANMPAVLVECAFINNPSDMAKFNVNQVARAIAEGVREVFPIGTGEIPAYPGTPLRVGSSGDAVRRVQSCLNNIGTWHPSIPRLTEDGIFGNGTHGAVVEFQRLFGLTQDGVVGPVTWNLMMTECSSGGGGGTTIPPFPGNLSMGSSGQNVRLVQEAINIIAPRFPGKLWILNADGQFGPMTRDAIFAFQSAMGLPITGVVNQTTWNRLMQEAHGSGGGAVRPPFPGTSLRIGSSGEPVRQIQRCLNAIRSRFPSIPLLVVDGSFGNATHNAVVAFQRAFGLTQDGIVGPITWNRIMDECGSSFQSLTGNEPGCCSDSVYTEEPFIPAASPMDMRMPMLLMLLAMGD